MKIVQFSKFGTFLGTLISVFEFQKAVVCFKKPSVIQFCDNGWPCCNIQSVTSSLRPALVCEGRCPRMRFVIPFFFAKIHNYSSWRVIAGICSTVSGALRNAVYFLSMRTRRKSDSDSQ